MKLASCYAAIRARTHLAKATPRIVLLGLAVTLAAISPSAASASDTVTSESVSTPLKVLHIGNSFSNNAAYFLPQLAQAGGKELLIAGATIGGCTLERHARHLNEAKEGKPSGSAYEADPALGLTADKKTVTLIEALEAQDWNVVTIQQGSRLSTSPGSYEPFAGQLIAQIREQVPEATILIHQTWAYRADNPRLISRGMTPEDMHMRVTDAYTRLGNRYNLGFLPSGNAVYAASKTDAWSFAPDPDYNYQTPPTDANPNEKRGLYPGNRWLRRDGKRQFILDSIHMNIPGRYLIGCVWYEILFNDSVLDVGFVPEELTPEQAQDLRRIAHETVAAYRSKGAL